MIKTVLECGKEIKKNILNKNILNKNILNKNI